MSSIRAIATKKKKEGTKKKTQETYSSESIYIYALIKKEFVLSFEQIHSIQKK
jgi:hypothetical protein